MSITRRATFAHVIAATPLSPFAGAAIAQDDHKARIRILRETVNQNDPALPDRILAEDRVNIPADPGRVRTATGPGRGFQASPPPSPADTS